MAKPVSRWTEAIIDGRARAGASRKNLGEALTASWGRAAAVILAVAVVAAILIGLSMTGRLGDLRYANIPWIHPYPTAA